MAAARLPSAVLSKAHAEAIWAALVEAPADTRPSKADFVRAIAYPSDKYRDKTLVSLFVDFNRGGSFQATELVKTAWWKIWKARNPWVALGEVNGKHSEVTMQLSDLVTEEIDGETDADAIYTYLKIHKAPNDYLIWESFFKGQDSNEMWADVDGNGDGNEPDDDDDDDESDAKCDEDDAEDEDEEMNDAIEAVEKEWGKRRCDDHHYYHLPACAPCAYADRYQASADKDKHCAKHTKYMPECIRCVRASHYLPDKVLKACKRHEVHDDECTWCYDVEMGCVEPGFAHCETHAFRNRSCADCDALNAAADNNALHKAAAKKAELEASEKRDAKPAPATAVAETTATDAAPAAKRPRAEEKAEETGEQKVDPWVQTGSRADHPSTT